MLAKRNQIGEGQAVGGDDLQVCVLPIKKATFRISISVAAFCYPQMLIFLMP